MNATLACHKSSVREDSTSGHTTTIYKPQILASPMKSCLLGRHSVGAGLMGKDIQSWMTLLAQMPLLPPSTMHCRYLPLLPPSTMHCTDAPIAAIHNALHRCPYCHHPQCTAQMPLLPPSTMHCTDAPIAAIHNAL